MAEGRGGYPATRVAGPVWAAAVAVVASCTPHPVGPARTEGAYTGKARTTVEEALSAVETARLTVSASEHGQVLGTYAAMVLSEQEDALDQLRGTFRSVQPPSASSDALGEEVSSLLGKAGGHLGAARIAARRGGGPSLGATGPALAVDARALRRFLEDHPA